MATKKPENLSFEQALDELSLIVTEMEQGELSLEQSLKQFERGIALAGASSSKLQQAEQKVAILMGSDSQSPLTNFDNDLE
ncbi:exodeoxyribonuclease VII small subunit [Pseudoalteromonas sp. SR44-5]|jgi:exodeoxyribonuclease VII small subunit|uniref:Exodeoxyribonuclease 7 small subunit n=2 Tax=Pseudoalteromonas TaxID=53246 RepID=A0ABY3F9H7_9GAMM|nr:MULTISPECIES: exodeoxyribonuclease VII small subunit [Pseudoalteromonas]MBB1293175.1 exodeoxyribonuclease VII small subunit [Pseudoalteromonas sp. SR41-4]MBB1302192.1 exodeoxyribonuclease VII small subunit [Pseudoalteromonas sp. SR44-8]MBB1310571.1 exodeoxyribonuclease VII small subunit [Pseudoalteromonas sp. SR41-8]MBB1333617.1 exodeoxyribonuclease VII small subunit [Pseudoalteromonas sp. SR41-6]MBB1341529.1 exodeoxyribonuclease VII small subunit [Pseudoalteromonas sp. SR45-6]|tara:strand:+ start:7079 stop:7321 length:243 start_codon:yes stop_codon:yes gene_type:complete